MYASKPKYQDIKNNPYAHQDTAREAWVRYQRESYQRRGVERFISFKGGGE